MRKNKQQLSEENQLLRAALEGAIDFRERRALARLAGIRARTGQ